MKYIIKLIIAIMLPLIACEAFANSYMGKGKGECYFGADLQIVYIKPQPAYKDFFKNQHPGGDIYLGYRFNRNVSLEFGYSSTTRDSKTTKFTAGQIIPGGTAPIVGDTDATGKIRYRNTHLDLNGYYQITKKIDGIVSLGIGFVRPNIKISFSNPASTISPEFSNIKCKTKAVLRAGIGFENMVDKYWGMRLMFRCENTSNVAVKGYGVAGDKIWKNGSSVALGFYRYLD